MPSSHVASLPTVSVIVPAFNAEATIGDTIASVLAQTFTDFEVLVIDDGSTDGTLDRLAGFRDERVRILTYDNAGFAEARNRGIRHARGEFVSFIDADDLWAPEKLARQVETLRREPEAGVAYSWTAFIDQDGRFLFAKEPLRFTGDVYKHLLTSFFLASGSNFLIRRSCLDAVGLFDPSLRSGEDWDYALRAALEWPYVVVPRYDVLYRLGLQTMSSQVERMEEGALGVVDKAFRSAPPELLPPRKACLANVKQYVAFLYLARTRPPDRLRGTGRSLFESFRLDPRSFFSWKSQHILWAWLLLHLVPAPARSEVIRILLRLHGRLSILWRPQLRVWPILSRL